MRAWKEFENFVMNRKQALAILGLACWSCLGQEADPWAAGEMLQPAEQPWQMLGENCMSHLRL